MSFNYNPYKHMELVVDDETEELIEKDYVVGTGWKWHCHGCGADSKQSWSSLEDMLTVIKDYFAHILKSHARKPEDFDSWSKH